MCDENGCGSNEDLPELVVTSWDRRQFLAGATSLPLAAVLALPELSRAAAEMTETVEITTDGGKRVSAAMAVPKAEKAPAVLLIHEWWGLNDQIKSVAMELANQGYLALAVDLYDGNVANTAEDARALMEGVNPETATDTLDSWIAYLRQHGGGTGRVGTVGWCFGGGWSLNTSVSTPVDATVIYYGNVRVGPDRLANLRGPVLGHFATQDGWIDQTMVDEFEFAMEDAGKYELLSVHWYEAHHGFANPTSARYDAEDASLAWERTLAFYADHLV